jgi:hypothetical protein
MVKAGRNSSAYPDREAFEATRCGERSPFFYALILPEANRLSEVATQLGSENPLARADAVTDLVAAFKRRFGRISLR